STLVVSSIRATSLPSLGGPSARRSPVAGDAGSPRPEPTTAVGRPVPVVEVSTERLLVETGATCEERDVAVLRLWFQYGSQELRVTDPRDGFFVSDANGVAQVQRDRVEEQRCQTVLESFGAVELGCLEELGVAGQANADYLVSINDSVHSLCSFSAYALPQLR